MSTRKRVLTRDEERIVRRAIARGATDYEASQEANVSARRLYSARRAELADLPRQKRGPRPDRVYGPAPELEEIPVEEIYRRAAELRAQWSEEERRLRWSPGFSGEPDA